MPTNSNKLSQFWQELKRRKVSRVITVYAAAAFVILELVDIIADPLKLPEWFMPMVIVLLCIGFIIAVILSWIYDVNPKEGIVKTEPAHKLKTEDFPRSSNTWKIASYISFIVIVVLIVLNVIPRSNRLKGDQNLEKSIAVLPLEYLSEDPNKQYLANGVLDAITGHLSLIEGLRVMPRTSVEQYRENKKTAKQIGEELGVSYLIEGSFLMIEDQVKLTIQLVVANEGDHMFFKEYDRNYKDILNVQSEVAQTIAKEIEIAITPEKQALLEKVPTTSLTAYDFYQQGKDEHFHYWLDNDNRAALERAEELYHEALVYDSTFAYAYTGLARVYWNKHYWETYFSESFLDSVFILTDIALYYDDQLAEAYTIRGDYYRDKGLIEKALEEYDKALKINPNNWMAYRGKGNLFASTDYVKALDNLQKAASLNRSSELPDIYREISMRYYMAGFSVKGSFYSQEALNLDGDSVAYYKYLGYGEWWCRGNFAKSIGYSEKGYAIDSSNISIINALGFDYMFVGQFEESLKYYKKYVEKLNALGNLKINEMHRVGYSYWKNGYKEEAEYYINEQLDYCIKAIELERQYSQNYNSYYDLATIYAFRDEKEKAYQNLRIFTQKKIMPLLMVTLIKKDPLFDNIREEPEFQQIVHDVEAKYQAEHEKVRKWLEENDML